MATQGRRRALGQHFLKDRAIARQIAETALEQARLHRCRTLLEIGPGRGAITEPLLEGLSRAESPLSFIVCERDARIADLWKSRPGLKVELADFLELPEDRWLSAPPIAVVSNLPYSAGTAILVRLARQVTEIPVMVLMFQAEVARRLRAEPSTKEWGSLSIWIQNRWDVSKLCSVPPSAFQPPPEVQSEVVILARRPVPRVAVPPERERAWESLLRAAFAHRRKMLRSGLPSGTLRNALEAAGVDGTRRAEQLTWEDWDRLFRFV